MQLLAGQISHDVQTGAVVVASPRRIGGRAADLGEGFRNGDQFWRGRPLVGHRWLGGALLFRNDVGRSATCVVTFTRSSRRSGPPPTPMQPA